jgi:hypothetical protein
MEVTPDTSSATAHITTTPTMTNARTTKEEFDNRCEEAADLLAEGHPGRAVVKKLSERYGVTPQAARAYVRRGEELAKESVPVHDRAFLFAQTFAGLQADRMDAREAGNINAQVGASKQLVQMLKLINDIDPMRDFENAFMRAAAPHLSNGKGIIPRESITLAAPDQESPF